MGKEKFPDHYRLLAPFYEKLGHLILGQDFPSSKMAFLEEVSSGDQVLVLGGGAGINIPDVLQRCGEKGKVTYMEASASMIRKCKSRLSDDLLKRISFVHADSPDILPEVTFDVVITQYFLDVLPDEKITQIFAAVHTRIDRHSRWIFADFFPLAAKRLQLKAMIVAFSLLTGHQRNDLPDYDTFFSNWGWFEKSRKEFCRGFYQARVYSLDPRSIRPETNSLK
ncbi:Methyltransferase domain-containing protein [Cyclobacterium lianum]|uniref:Methyltransferase domain-containing protein n=1 Tax=Cyclobacterium lianum TaxID=388280 RepID=A0A1M7KIQ2_9BACT|nr:class I SAM-dependent methyltransferase [Cyclobacterium lianum]SHM64768.1 Methyltransferase domain-containing protein [Cyclobacterium lianum]